MLPVKLVADAAAIGKVVVVVPTTMVEVGAVDESEKTATPVPDRATV